ncbi:UNVERIFIED_CONTAM: hypothetical protein Scaly_0187000 [Sesamum calycinum]|uniref:BRCT domain-containing protein n=1 Tax=Sesamum calycinum TaxID=2727403 RepID=A0AAW2SXG4_9LAMI
MWKTVNFSEAVADAIELCIAASEALVINEVIKSNSFAEPSTASAILEAALQKGNRLAVEKNSHAKNVSSSPIKSCHEKDNSVPEIVQERFQSRWFGGWTSNNEVEYFNTVKHDIPKPFAGETSFLSESADTAPDENSSVQNHDKGAIIASQLSMPSENFSNKANDRMLLSEDVVRSSSTSLVDPLCSIVPCSISEDICSSLAINHEDTALHGSLNIMVECKKDNLLGISPSNNVPTEGEGIPVATGNIKESRNDNAELTLLETRFGNHEETVMGGADYPVSQKGNGATLPLVLNHREHCQLQAFSCSVHKLAEENPNQTALPESKMKCASNLQRLQLECKNQSAQTLTASKRVHFSEKEINISDKKNLQKEQTVSKTCCSTRAAKRSTRSSVHLESKGPLMDKFLKVYLDKEKKRLIFQNMEFLLTGLSEKKEKEIEGLIRKYGGIVISQIPVTNLKGKRSSRFKSGVLPIVLCLKKIQSLKFLYGCAVNALVLKVNWLIDSIAVGFVLPTEKYASDVPKSTPCFISLLI